MSVSVRRKNTTLRKWTKMSVSVRRKNTTLRKWMKMSVTVRRKNTTLRKWTNMSVAVRRENNPGHEISTHPTVLISDFWCRMSGICDICILDVWPYPMIGTTVEILIIFVPTTVYPKIDEFVPVRRENNDSSIWVNCEKLKYITITLTNLQWYSNLNPQWVVYSLSYVYLMPKIWKYTNVI